MSESLPAKRRTDFFVSYAHPDHAWAEWIAWQLESSGYSVVIQAWDFKPGSNFVLEIDNAAVASDRTIAVLSSHYLNSNFAASEWAAAFAEDPTSLGRKLLPVRVDDMPISGLLAQIVWVNLMGCDEATAKDRLIAAAAGSRSKPTVPPSFPALAAKSIEGPAFPPAVSSISNLSAARDRNETDFPRSEGNLATRVPTVQYLWSGLVWRTVWIIKRIVMSLVRLRSASSFRDRSSALRRNATRHSTT